jgi:hypothetical protein
MMRLRSGYGARPYQMRRSAAKLRRARFDGAAIEVRPSLEDRIPYPGRPASRDSIRRAAEPGSLSGAALPVDSYGRERPCQEQKFRSPAPSNGNREGNAGDRLGQENKSLPPKRNSKDASIAKGAGGRDIPVMRTVTETQSTAFDPFGEPVADGVARACPDAAGDRTARRIGGAVFWTLALAILAGRVYAYDLSVVQSVATHAAQALALR